MKTTSLFLASLLCAAAASGTARLQVSVPSAAVRARPDPQAPLLGQVSQGTVLFATGAAQGGWTPVEPPPDVALWLNGDFVVGTRVVAKSVQLRTGPGIEHDVAGTLSRGATVMKLGEDGEWLKIAPPSSASVWVETSQVAPVAEAAAPIREVEPVSFLPVATVSDASPAPPSSPDTPLVAPSSPSAPPPDPLRIETTPTPPRAGDIVDPSKPVTPFRPDPTPAPTPVAHPVAPAPVPRPAQTARPVVHPAPTVQPSRPAVHPAPARLASTAPRPVPGRPPAGSAGPVLRPAPHAQPAAAIVVDPALVAQLRLSPGATQGRPVRVQGELRNAPFAKGTPSRFRLVPRNSADAPCLLHGDPARLRPFVGKAVVVRGKAYAVAETDQPVVVVGEISLAP